MCSIKSLVIASVLLFTSSAKTAKDAIGFPETEENPDLKNKENRQPVFLPAMCPLNELYYPGDQKDDWICDCRPSFIYHPGSDACWPSHRRGPCTVGQYLTLPSNSVLPVCEKNPCNVDGYVTYNGKCEVLGASAPCNSMWYPTPAIVGVNSTTLVVSCVKVNLESRFGEEKPDSLSVCAPGSKRNVAGKCVPM